MDGLSVKDDLECEGLIPAPSPEQALSTTIQFVAAATNHYDEGGLVDLRVEDRVFRVSRNRLILRSPFFRKAFTLPQAQNGDAKSPEIIEIELHNDPAEFADFLWYIHADPLSAYEFAEVQTSEKKCSTLLGIASVAHMYEALDVARWAMKTVLSLLKIQPRGFAIGDLLAKYLLRTAARFQEGTDAGFLHDAREIVCDAMCAVGPLAEDPIRAVLVAQEPAVDDTYVLAHAYFYTLQKGNAYFQHDPRLRALDRQRLLCGGFALAQRKISQGLTSRPRSSAPSHVEFWEHCSHGELHWVTQSRVPVRVMHDEIESIREELWGMFDSTAWRLSE